MTLDWKGTPDGIDDVQLRCMFVGTRVGLYRLAQFCGRDSFFGLICTC